MRFVKTTSRPGYIAYRVEGTSWWIESRAVSGKSVTIAGHGRSKPREFPSLVAAKNYIEKHPKGPKHNLVRNYLEKSKR